jgi:hypothetical protein
VRFLVSPVYMNLSKLGSSSTYHHVSNLIERLVARGHFVYWHLPSNVEYVTSPLENHSRVQVIRTEMTSDQYIEAGEMRGLDRMFNRNDGEYQVDGVITSRTACLPLLKKLIETPSAKSCSVKRRGRNKRWTGLAPKMPFFVLEVFPKKRSGTVLINDVEYDLQTVGYLNSERVYFGGAVDHARMIQQASVLVSYAALRRLRESIFRIMPFGVNLEKLARVSVNKPDPMDCLNVISVGRIRTTNHAQKVVEQADYMFRRGYKVDYKIPTSANNRLLPATLGKALQRVIERVPILWGTPQDKFFEIMAQSHVAVNTSGSHNFPTAILEAIVLGTIVLVRKERWIQYYLGDAYPFYYDGGHAQLLAMMGYIRENWADAQAKLQPFRDKVVKDYGIDKCYVAIIDDVEAIATSFFEEGTDSRGFMELMRGIPQNSITWPEVLQYIEKNSDTGVKVGRNSATGFMSTKGMVDYSMRRIGWVDTCEGPHPVYVRGESDYVIDPDRPDVDEPPVEEDGDDA